MRNPGSALYAARAVVLLSALVAVASCGREATSIRVGQLPGHLYLDVKA